jgi:hypothetical protein
MSGGFRLLSRWETVKLTALFISHIRFLKINHPRSIFLFCRSIMIPVRDIHLLILLKWILPGSCVLLSVPDATTVFEKHLLKGIVSISSTYFNISNSLAILTADTWSGNKLHNGLGDAVLREIHAANKWPVVTFSSSGNMYSITGKTAVKPSIVLLILNEDERRSEDLLQRMLTSFSVGPSWNPSAHFVIVSTTVPSSTRDQRERALSALNITLSLDILDAIFLIPEQVHSDRTEENLIAQAIDVFTWFPFDSKNRATHNLDVTFLDRWEKEEERRESSFRNNTNLFPSKLITDLRRRNVTMAYGMWPPLVMSSDNNATTRPDEGLEIRIIKTVAETTNFNLILRRPGDHVKVDGYFGAQWFNTDLPLPFDGTWTHFAGAFSWFVPNEKDIPRWQSLVKIFNPSLWLIVLLVYVLGSLTLWALASTQRSDRETASFSNITLVFMSLLSMILSESVYKKPKGAQTQMFFLLWSFYCLQINTAYQSSLIGFLTNPGHLPRINDLDGLLESGIELGIQRGLKDHFNDGSDPRNKLILKSYIDCDFETSLICLDRMAYKGDLAVAGGRNGLEFLSYIKYMKNGKPLYVPLKDNIKQGHMVIYLRKGNILLKRIDSIVLRLQNAGLIDKWVNDIRRKFGKHFGNVPINDDFCVLTMSHLEGAFSLLLLGMLLSVTTWFLEIIHHSVVHRFRKRRQITGNLI